jgi:glycosyltransferase involved in cell wall biosynthesis
VDVIVLIDPRDDLENKAFGCAEIAAYKRANPHVKILHRINECDQRKATTFMDGLLAEANELADYTVFISKWLRDYHGHRWFNTAKPHRCIYNGADPKFFHPIGNRPFHRGDCLRLMTHHWSNNPMKGFDIYERVDDLIATGRLKDVEFWVVGQWPANIHWKRAKTCPPKAGGELAALLRSCHVYLTASRWEPCGMHHVEGAQCGLPLLYHEDGGGIVEAGLRYGIGYRDDIVEAIEKVRDAYPVLRDHLLEDMPSGDRMCMTYLSVIQHLLCMYEH